MESDYLPGVFIRRVRGFLDWLPYLCPKFHRRMLRQCTAILLLLAFAASTFSKAVIVVDFYANQDYITKNLCENRDKPTMHCCGRCQLRKRFNREEDHDKNKPESRSENKKEVLFHDETASMPTASVLLAASPHHTPLSSAGSRSTAPPVSSIHRPSTYAS